MKKIFTCCLIVTALLSSCVSETEHQKVIDEKISLSVENEKLKTELEEIKFGAPNLLADGKKFFEAKEFSKSREKFQTLLEKHPDLPQSIEAKKYLTTLDEEELWQEASQSNEISISEKYISQYPKGKYISKAIGRKEELKKLNMHNAYEDATNSNSSYAWKNFLEDYPNHKEANAIRDKIIRLEVDEIMGNRNTGQMPSFNQNSYSYSSSSSVEITNNTGCSLTVRYSGADVKIIEIPNGGTRRVNLSSGTYKVAASACGENYAGTESLQGSYSSSFYIETRRY